MNPLELERRALEARRKIRSLRILAPLAFVAGLFLGWQGYHETHKPGPAPAANPAASGCIAPDPVERATLEASRDMWREHSGRWRALARQCGDRLEETERALSYLLQRQGRI